MLYLFGKVAIVSGASTGIGYEIALRLGRAGQPSDIASAVLFFTFRRIFLDYRSDAGGRLWPDCLQPPPYPDFE